MKRLIVLRPEPGATSTVELAGEFGLDAVALPLFEVKSVPWQLPDPSSFDGLLFTSANALRHGGEQLTTLRGLKAYCVGGATAEAARERGFDIAATGEAGVDRLLGSIEAGIKLLHLASDHHTQPSDAKQDISRIVVYASEQLPAPTGLADAESAVVAVHSRRAAGRFSKIVDDRGLDRSSIAVAAISPGAASEAGDGWLQLDVAERPDDPSLLALARSMCQRPRRP